MIKHLTDCSTKLFATSLETVTTRKMSKAYKIRYIYLFIIIIIFFTPVLVQEKAENLIVYDIYFFYRFGIV